MTESGRLRYEDMLVLFKPLLKGYFSVCKSTKAEIILKIKEMS